MQSRSEIGVALAAAVVLVAMTQVAVGTDDDDVRTRAAVLRDMAQLRETYTTFVIFSQDHRDRYPTPGLINRLMDPQRNRELPGAGPEDPTRNTTAALYSVLIAQAYFLPDLVISPLERNPEVTEDTDYDYDAYQPANDTYWDGTFAADLKTGSNASFAHQVIHGERKEHRWRLAPDASWPVLGSRGPLGGRRNHRSNTCGPLGHWAGNAVFADAHVETRETMTFQLTGVPEAERVGDDNIFRMETGAGGDDAILSFTLTNGAVAADLEIQHD